MPHPLKFGHPIRIVNLSKPHGFDTHPPVPSELWSSCRFDASLTFSPLSSPIGSPCRFSPSHFPTPLRLREAQSQLPTTAVSAATRVKRWLANVQPPVGSNNSTSFEPERTLVEDDVLDKARRAEQTAKERYERACKRRNDCQKAFDLCNGQREFEVLLEDIREDVLQAWGYARIDLWDAQKFTSDILRRQERTRARQAECRRRGLTAAEEGRVEYAEMMRARDILKSDLQARAAHADKVTNENAVECRPIRMQWYAVEARRIVEKADRALGIKPVDNNRSTSTARPLPQQATPHRPVASQPRRHAAKRSRSVSPSLASWDIPSAHTLARARFDSAPEDCMDEAYENVQRQRSAQRAFTRARPHLVAHRTDFASSTPLPPRPAAPVDDEEDALDYAQLSHADWEAKFQVTPLRRSRRSEEADRAPSHLTSSSTAAAPQDLGVLGKIQVWISTAWTTVKRTLFG